MKKIILFLVIIISCSISFAQNVIRFNDSILLNRCNSYMSSSNYILDNMDNDKYSYFYLVKDKNGDSTMIYKTDINLTIVDSFTFNKPTELKMNNKFYYFGYIYDTINSNISLYIGYNKYNSSENYSKLVYTFGYNPFYTCMMSDSNFVLFWYSHPNDSTYNCNAITFDTLGNLLNNHSYVVNVNGWWDDIDFHVNKDNLEIDRVVTNLAQEGAFSVYHIDRNTLSITDTAVYDTIIMPYHRKIINDSICVSVSDAGEKPINDCDYFPVYIYNIKTNHLIDTIKFSLSSFSYPYFHYNRNDECMDFINPDSIYLCYYSSDSADMGQYYCLHIANFNINGHVNFIYKLASIGSYNVSSIMPTTDGGVILAVYNVYKYENAFIKFMPNGLVSISSVNKEDVFVLTYPNPASDEINVVSSEKMNKVEIINMLGQVVFQKELNNKNLKVNTSNFNKGNYFVKIYTDKGETTKKVIVE
jgi:hypothetical protein